jgi:hypothetical protein
MRIIAIVVLVSSSLARGVPHDVDSNLGASLMICYYPSLVFTSRALDRRPLPVHQC